MATIINSTPWTRQPQGAVGIDWSNPLSVGLVGVSIGKTVIHPTQTTAGGTYGGSVATRQGIAHFSGSGTTNAGIVIPSSSIHPLSTTTNPNCSQVAVVYRATTDATTRAISCNAAAGTSTALLWRMGSGQTPTLVSQGAAIISSSSAVIAAGDVAAIGFSIASAGGSTTFSHYKDGRPSGSSTGTSPSLTGGGTNALLGSQTNASSGGQVLSVLLHLSYSRALTDAEMRVLTANPWQIFRPLPRRIFVPAPTSSGLYTLTAQSGSYAISGQQATLLRHRNLTASSGTYNITGQSVNITYSPTAAVYTLTAQSGSYALIGRSATLLKSKLLSASSGSYSITGNSATISKNRVLTATSGLYTITGHSATLTYIPLTPVYTLTAQTGVYNITGQTAQLLRHRLLTTSSGSYVYTGQSIIINKYTSGTSSLVKYVNVLTGEVLILKQLGV